MNHPACPPEREARRQVHFATAGGRFAPNPSFDSGPYAHARPSTVLGATLSAVEGSHVEVLHAYPQAAWRRHPLVAADPDGCRLRSDRRRQIRHPSWARNFARWGYPDGFYMVIGVLEAAGGLALLVPRLTSYTAAMLGVIMIAASLTHWLHGEMARVTPPLMYLAVLVIVGVGRWRSAIRFRAASARPAPLQSL